MWFPNSDVAGETTDGWFSQKNAFEVRKFKFNLKTSDLVIPPAGEAAAKKAGFEARKAALQQALPASLGGLGQGDKDRSASINMAQGAARTQADRAAVRAKFSEFRITKDIDYASPKLYKACTTGDPFPSAILALRKPGGQHVLYIQFIFRDVTVTSIDWDGGEGDKPPSEDIDFEFKAMGFQYTKQTSTGQANSAPQIWLWSTATNTSTLEIRNLPPAPDFVSAASFSQISGWKK